MRASGPRDRFLADEMLRHLAVITLELRRGRERLAIDPEPRYALEHACELLAEAAEKTSRPFKSANPAIPWNRLRGLRREVAHPYDQDASPIDVDQLWRFARDDAPAVAKSLRRAKFP